MDICVFLCDESGIMAEPWAEAGYQCYCVDVQHSIRRERVEGNIHFVWGDVRSWKPPVGSRVVFLGAFPPCTHVAGSGARDFKTKGLPMLRDSLELFEACETAAAWSGARYFIENPVGVFSTHVRKPDYKFDPCEYAGYLDDPSEDAYTKETCL